MGDLMTTVRTRADEIFATEGFSVIIRYEKSGKQVPLGRNGVIGQYPRQKKTNGGITVAKWKGNFEEDNPGYTCDVLKADGKKATGQTILGTVRDTY